MQPDDTQHTAPVPLTTVAQAGRVRAAASVMMAVSIGMLPVFMVGGLTPLIRLDFTLGEAEIGLVVGIFFLSSASGSFYAGRRAGLADTDTLRTALAVLGVLAVLAAVLANSWWHLALWSLTSGFVNGLLQPAANLLLLARFDRGLLGRAIGFKQAAVPFASATVGLAIPVIGLTLGWRIAFALIPVLCIVMLVISPPRGDTASGTRPVAAVASGAGTTRALVLFALGGGLGAGSGLTATSFYIVTALERGIEKGVSGLLLASTSLTNMTTLILAGIIADRWPKVISPRVIAGMLAMGAVGYGVVATSDSIVGLGVGAAIAMGLGWGWHSLFHLNVASGAFGGVGRATGIAMSGIFGGGLVLPVVYGAIAGRAGHSVGWMFLSGCVASASLLFLIAGRSASISASKVSTPD
jgi:MFS family permease